MPNFSAASNIQAPKYELIKDRNKRTNLKSKRTRTLFRKAIEVSRMCNLDIFIMINDRDSSRVLEYNSTHPVTQQLFGIEDAFKHATNCLNAITNQTRFYKRYTDTDYESLKQQPRIQDLLDIYSNDPVEETQLPKLPQPQNRSTASGPSLPPFSLTTLSKSIEMP